MLQHILSTYSRNCRALNDHDDRVRSLLSSDSKMLSPTSAAQKNLSEEDSSGSDGESVGQEPETDRFGFILTNGSTAG